MKQVSLIIMLTVVGFAVALVVYLAGRLSAEEVALLGGVVCGIGVAVPLGVLVGAVVAAGRRRNEPAASLPVIYVTRPPHPTVVGSPPTSAQLPLPRAAARPLNIIGQNSFDAEQ